MDILNDVISVMNKEDIRFFKLYLSKTTVKGERKDITLFDYIRKSAEKYDEDKIFGQLYGKGDKNAFYRLKNRLLEDINKSLMTQHFEKDDFILTLHLIALAKYFYSKTYYKIARYYVRRAERKALELSNAELLDLIYGEYIRLSHEILEINPEEYVAKRNENFTQLQMLREIDNILAIVSYRIKTSQNFSSDRNPILPLLQKTIDEVTRTSSVKQNPVLRFRIYQAVSQLLLQKRDYATLEEYLLSTYEQFTREKLFNRNNHNTKLQMLTYIVNALFKNKKYDRSLAFAGQLLKAMEEHEKLLYDKYLFFYYNSLVINYSKLDKDQAIKLLEELKGNEKTRNLSYYRVFIDLNLAILWFDKHKYDLALKSLTRLYIQDEYKSMDDALKFRISVAELMIRYEQRDFDFLDYKMKQMRKDFSDLLKTGGNEKESEFLDILKMMATSRMPVPENKKVMQRIGEFVASVPEEADSDNEIINYREWLSSKLPARQRRQSEKESVVRSV